MALSKSQQSLRKWTKQRWTTSDGSKSEGKKRYLPKAAWNALSPAQKAATNKAKAEGNKKGKQFVKQPKKIAQLVKKFRKYNNGGSRPTDVPKHSLQRLKEMSAAIESLKATIREEGKTEERMAELKKLRREWAELKAEKNRDNYKRRMEKASEAVGDYDKAQKIFESRTLREQNDSLDYYK